LGRWGSGPRMRSARTRRRRKPTTASNVPGVSLLDRLARPRSSRSSLPRSSKKEATAADAWHRDQTPELLDEYAARAWALYDRFGAATDRPQGGSIVERHPAALARASAVTRAEEGRRLTPPGVWPSARGAA
jgi:hypothetical protein